MNEAITHLAEQVAEIDAALAKLPYSKREWTRAVLIGMGGSALGAHVVQSLFANELRAPFEWRNAYTVPGYADENTLVILSSYSGTTEEVIAAYKEAKKRKTGVVVLTSGGELMKLAEKDGAPSVIFSTEANPGGQPRNGVVYNIVGVMGVLERAGILARVASHADVAKAILAAQKKYGDGRMAKKIVTHVETSIVMLAASEHLEGNLHIMQNQIHETAKHFAFTDTVSELNHHLMEGLKYPADTAKNIAAVLFSSKVYGTRIQKRYPITADVLKKQKVKVMEIKLGGKSKLDDVAEMLVLGTLTSSLLAEKHGENPNFIPWVDYFKKKLA